jgi:PAS domain S-box-containing protein
LIANAGASEEELRDTSAFVPWSAFAALVDGAAQILGGTRALGEIGVAVVRAPSYRFLRTVAAYALSARQLLEIAVRWSGPALFPDVELELSHAPRGRVASWHDEVTVRVALGRELRACDGFFELTAGVCAGLPQLLGARAFVLGDSLLQEIASQSAVVTRTYHKLLESRQEFRDLLERAPMAVAIHRQGRFLWSNEACARMLGEEDPRALVGRHILDHVHPEERDQVVARLGVAADATGRGEYRLLRKDGSIVVCELAATQNVEFEGAPARLLLAVDITERVRVRQQLALSDRMASLGVLAASVAHEINNPLTYVQLNLQSMMRDLARGDASAMDAAGRMALEGVERVRSIVADLRTFARADEDTVGPVDLDDVIETTLRLAGKAFEASANIELHLGGVPPVRANRARLGQIVLALVINAYEAVEDSGQSGAIRVTTTTDGPIVQLEVADAGVGISAQDLTRVFEPFFTTKPIGRGTGLGLAICHRIVTSFGGTISINSDPSARGLRTFVRVRLPVAFAVDDVPASETPRSTARRRILVVDDEPQVARALELVLGEEHDVESETGGRAALERLARDNAFDLVLCDVMMPEIDGIEVYERTRARDPETARRFVFMSGGAYTARTRAFVASCGNPRLEKPFGLDQVRELAQKLAR